MVLTTIEESVVSTDESVTQNPERQTISALNAEHALAVDLNDVVLGRQLEGQLLHLNGDGGQLVNTAAARVNVDIQVVDGISGTNDQRSTSINNGSATRSTAALAAANVVTIDAELSQLDSPVVLADYGFVLKRTRELGGIDRTWMRWGW